MAEKGKEKVTMMKLKVDLDCAKCYKKVKKVLCKFPQIRDQLFDEKSNIVIIKVVCCSPERIMDKLCAKGGGSIKTIEIVEPPKPQPQAPPPTQKPKEAEKPKTQPQAEKPKEQEKPKPQPQPEKPKEQEKPKPQPEKPKEQEKPAAKPVPAPAPAPAPKPAGPPPQPIPMMPQGQPAMCCGPSYYDGCGGPAFNGYGMPPQPYECYGRPVYESWGGGCPPPVYRQCHVTRCDYFSEENPQSCSIM